MGSYNDPGTTASDIGTQFRTDYYQKKALIELKKEQYFSPLADVVSMPKHMGKTIKRYHYVPVLNDANLTDQGLDADGSATATYTAKIAVTMSDGSIPIGYPFADQHGPGNTRYIYGENTAAATAEDAAVDVLVAWAEALAVAGGLGLAPAGTDDQKAVIITTTGGESAYDLGYRFATVAGATYAGVATSLEASVVAAAGNLYGSSKDVGTIPDKMPALTETGGAVNRIGFTRIDLEGSLEKYGIYYDYTKESLDFDTDAELDMHCTRELLNAGNEITEDLLQIDLLGAAGVIRYGGDATSTATITGDTNDEENINVSVIGYEDLMKMEIDLDNNRCPKQTKVITGSRMVDTRVIPGARVMYIGSELIPMVKRMTDLFGNQAFIGVEHYAYAGDTNGSPNTINGEIGTIGGFRIVVVPEMMHWAGSATPADGGGAAVGSGAGTTPVNAGYRETAGYYDVFPMLVVGDASFTTIGFQTDGKTTKFKIKNVKPESDISYSADDPFGEMGFSSLKFYYGFMALRPERIALAKCVAEF